MSAIAALLLTGGASSRMGVAKAAIVVDGEPIARRLACLLGALAAPVFEVGPGYTELASVMESSPGAGPLAAIVAGHEALRRAGYVGAALVLACDLPLVSAELLAFLAGRPGDRSALPVVGGRSQPLCARWSTADLAAAGPLLECGERSLRSLPRRDLAELLGEEAWPATLSAETFADVDAPADLEALGLSWEPGGSSSRGGSH